MRVELLKRLPTAEQVESKTCVNWDNAVVSFGMNVCVVTAPVVFACGRDARLNRVAVDVSDCCEEVLVAGDGLAAESALEEMPGALVALVEVVCVRAVEVVRETGEPFEARLDHHVVVVAHQAVGVQHRVAACECRG